MTRRGILTATLLDRDGDANTVWIPGLVRVITGPHMESLAQKSGRDLIAAGEIAGLIRAKLAQAMGVEVGVEVGDDPGPNPTPLSEAEEQAILASRWGRKP